MGENSTIKHWVGFDLGGTKMLAAVLNDDLEILARRRRRTKGHRGVEFGLSRIVDTIEDALKEAELTADDLSGIGIGCPGPLDLDRGVILEAPNLGWENARVTKCLEDHFECPAVILNDVDSGVYGESRFGAAQNAHCVLGIFPGTGIGGGCVYQDQIIRGKTSSCLELGHIQVMPEGPLCGCGQRGCLESLASRLVIASQAAQAAFRGQAPNLREAAGTDLSDIRSGVLAAAIEAGDTIIEEIVREAARHIGNAVGSLVNLLAPDYVLLGGGLVEAMPDLFIKPVKTAANERVLPSYRDTFEVVAAELGDDATALGAAAWAQHVMAQ